MEGYLCMPKGEDSRAGGLAYATRTAKEVGVGYALLPHGVFERLRDAALPDYRLEIRWAVLPRGDNVFHTLFLLLNHANIQIKWLVATNLIVPFGVGGVKIPIKTAF